MKIRVATVQMESLNNDYEGNLSRAERHINDGVSKAAKLILLPEFALVGYEFTDSIWKLAEPVKGRTYTWVKGLCERHNVYIGTCILENYEGDFYDTFILVRGTMRYGFTGRLNQQATRHFSSRVQV